MSYIGIRELGYRGIEIGQALNLGAGGVSLALRRGESSLRERPEIKEEILKQINSKIVNNVPPLKFHG